MTARAISAEARPSPLMTAKALSQPPAPSTATKGTAETTWPHWPNTETTWLIIGTRPRGNHAGTRRRAPMKAVASPIPTRARAPMAPGREPARASSP